MAAPLEMAFRSQEDALAELVTSEERYVKTLSTFRTVRAAVPIPLDPIDESIDRGGGRARGPTDWMLACLAGGAIDRSIPGWIGARAFST